MKKPSKVVPFPSPENRVIASDEQSGRMIFRIGKRRLAFDFFTRVTELPPTTGDRPAPIIPMKNNRGQNRPSPAKEARISKEGA
jgi:hypothetical protein